MDPSNGLNTQDVLTLGLSSLALLVSIWTLIYTVRQVGLLRSQIGLDLDMRVAAVNRELLTMAFNDPELFNVLDDKPLSNPHKERHYVQMWFNHVHTMWNVQKHGLKPEAEWYSDVKDIALLFSLTIVKKHWEDSKSFFPADFVQFIATLKNFHPEDPAETSTMGNNARTIRRNV